jgi:hypothetical protein
MRILIGAAIVTAALAFGGPVAMGSTARATKVTAHTASPPATTDISARRRTLRRHYRYAYRPYYPYYYDRPNYYRPYPYPVPAPFTFGFGFGPWW